MKKEIHTSTQESPVQQHGGLLPLLFTLCQERAWFDDNCTGNVAALLLHRLRAPLLVHPAPSRHGQRVRCSVRPQLTCMCVHFWFVVARHIYFIGHWFAKPSQSRGFASNCLYFRRGTNTCSEIHVLQALCGQTRRVT